MLTTLLVAATLFGTDPSIVFSQERVPSFPPSMAFSDQSPLTPGTSAQSAATGSDSRLILVGCQSLPAGQCCVTDPRAMSIGVCDQTSAGMLVRGQNVSDDPRYSQTSRLNESIWEDPYIKQLLDELNPFAPLQFQNLMNYYDPFGIQMGTGTFGQQGYRLGWSTYNEISVLPATQAFGTAGNMKVTQWNSNARYSTVLQPGVLFNGTFWFDARWWDGPSGVALPGQVDQFSTDLELGFFDQGPWSGQIAFHPQIVETYEAKLDRNAFNFDGRAVATYKASPQWSFVGGVAVWDRVNTLIIPHVGAVWTPNNRWEVRALFPKSRVSYFLGNWRNADFWAYGQYEYTAEAWQSIISPPSMAATSDRIQITDQRLTAGLRWDKGRYIYFTEAGYVFDRHVKFAGAAPSYDLGNTAIISVGFRY